ncbi:MULTISPECIES: hypothetical protein [Actinomycetaceae]|uniref:hypothetical protein n=1 Tax=Actinomycetaceae TaxID=2049 RepID=UPI001EC5ADA9|nr:MULTISPECIES: hypothetical protein [Actinomycetaceae]MBS5826291.1 hypothetical protein [Actinomyces sp.]MDK7143677.1 hypothetical protein [Gleimia europaea]MDU6679845.1 hypothetical protein [Actinomyces sp.]
MVSVNLIQHKVLQWHSKVETDPPNDEWKTSASAVEGGRNQPQDRRVRRHID